MRFLVPLVLGGALLAHTGQRAADAARNDVDAEVELMFIPSGQALRVASLGWRVHVADLLWLRSVLNRSSSARAGAPGGVRPARTAWALARHETRSPSTNTSRLSSHAARRTRDTSAA